MFLNISNHCSKQWSGEQVNEARQYGEIKDYPFPNVNAEATVEDIEKIAEVVVSEVKELNPYVCMCQGEFTLTYAIVSKLKEKGIRVVAACSERKTVEIQLPNGNTKKESEFSFVKFREY